jgi:VanZ family protein
MEIDYSDKFYHFIAYGLLIFWFCQVFEKKSYPFLTTIFILQGVVIEVLQNFTNYRTLELGDILANTSGVISLLLLAGKYHQLLEKLEQNYLFKKNTKSKTVN